MTPRLNLINKKFGRLTVVDLAYIKNQSTFWSCLCDCGKVVIKKASYLTTGDTRSCGCLKSEELSKRNSKHNLYKHPIYNVWKNMKNRCYRINNKQYSNYGGRGITVCEEWKKDFLSFFTWANENGYKNNLTIDRIDVDGNYCPENCRFIPLSEQQKNKRNTIIIEYMNMKYTISEFSQLTSKSYDSIYRKIQKGMSPEEIIND